VRDQGVVGVTSNPTIFQQAITQSADYNASLGKLVAQGLDPGAIFDRLSIEDIQMACDRLRPVYDRTHGVDGRVSIEVGSKLDRAITDAASKLPAGDARRVELEGLRGKAAIANARLAYARCREVFGSPRFATLASRGARIQRPLWASTSTKDPAFPDTLYV